jgi:very-short-patch-repair endonuclease
MSDRILRRRIVRHACIDASKLALARRFRREPTPAEAAVWELLRNREILGMKFRRQQVVSGFIVDFYCRAARLVLEVDGSVHDDPAHRERDAVRTEVLTRQGLRVVRLPNERIDEGSLRESLARYAAPQNPRASSE